ncbi:pilus assembly protein TadG-related protein [Cupriavidus necator]|uniref:pilus assembly protein TadG-related protein n=1 Tax=Cupriavidus necator TaxID=106590 RepID=UPI0013DF45D2|nr:pilus assembly protein TadG-related protein [Cupriavidus necator]
MLSALFIVALLSFAALAIDVGYLFVVRNQLQNAADAAALNGANNLYRPGTTFKAYSWVNAEGSALTALQQNVADGANLNDASIDSGYWNTKTYAYVTPASASPGPNDVPAVRVSVSKSSGHNNGPVKTYLAQFIGVSVVPVGATAIAVAAAPDTITPGGLLPIVVSQCRYDQAWDSTKTPPQPRLQNNAPVQLYIGSGTPSNGSPVCQKDNSLFSDLTNVNRDNNPDTYENNASTIKMMGDMFNKNSGGSLNGNPNPVSLANPVWILGQADQIAQNVLPKIKACSAAGNKSCEYSTVMLIDNTEGQKLKPIISFVCVRIVDATYSSSGNYYLTVEMSTRCQNDKSAGLASPRSVYRIGLAM